MDDLSGVDLDTMRELMRRMLLIREFEQAVGVNFARGEIPGFTHLSIGEEAVAAGVCLALSERDMLTSTHRGHGHCLAKGSDPNRVMAEIYGREDGLCLGRGGSMHLYDFQNGVLGTNGIVASGGGLACGAALAARAKGSDAVVAVFMGDGATDEGATHEAMNLAAVWKLPVIFVIDNNGYSQGTPLAAHTLTRNLVERADAYGIPGTRVDGQDAVAVWTAATSAVARARRGEGPTVIEAITTRNKGHFEGDAMKYTFDASWTAANRDPIDQLTRVLVDEHGVSVADLNSERAAVVARVDAAVDFARQSPIPGPERLMDHLFATV